MAVFGGRLALRLGGRPAPRSVNASDYKVLDGARKCHTEQGTGNSHVHGRRFPLLLHASGLNAGYRAAVLQVRQRSTGPCRLHPPPDRSAEQPQCVRQSGQPVIAYFFRLNAERRQPLIADGTAVEQKPHASRPARAPTAKVHARQAATAQFDAALLANLAPTGLPRRLAVCLHHAARYGPPRLIRWLQDQQPVRPVEYQRSGRDRDRREPPALIRWLAAITGHNRQVTTLAFALAP